MAEDDIVAMRRRAELRGLEAEARSRVNVGVWTVRLYATANGLTSALALATGAWRTGLTLAVWATGLVLASNRLERGKRSDGWILFALFLLGNLAQFTQRDPDIFELGLAAASLIGIGVGIRGVMALARIRREQDAASDPIADAQPTA